jgi:hypothetical protein
MTPSRRASGQAMPLALGLVALGALSLVILYNLGQTIAARTRLTHTADAAAYSGALVQARALNLIAYLNRAQIAHQVAMAHLVTLASWTQFGKTERERLLRGNPPGPLISMLFGPSHGRAYASAAAGSDAAALLRDFEQAHDRHDRLVHSVLAATTRATIDSMHATRQQAMQAVVHANYPEFKPPATARDGSAARDRLAMDVLVDDWPGFVRRYAGNGRGAFRPMVLAATDRYGFLEPRIGTARNAWPVSSRCPTRRHELRRRGGTSLSREGAWRAIDTQSFHKLRSNKYIGCYFREYAMGWGKVDTRRVGADAQGDTGAVDAPADFSQQDFWRWVRQHTSWDIVNGVSNPLAYAYAIHGTAKWRGQGLPAYAEIPHQRAGRPARFVLRLAQPAPLLQTTDARSTVASPRGRLSYAGLLAEHDVGVTSAAETYFSRPTPRKGQAEELATLFRPYWQARLAAPAAPAALPVGGGDDKARHGP